MISYGITKHFKIRYCIEGIRFDFKIKGKWFSIKLNRKELEFLRLLIKIISE